MQTQSIKKNYIYNTLYKILTIITPLITAPYASRVFGADGVGIQSYVLSILAFFVLFAGLGTATYGQREVAMYRNNKQKSSQIFWEIELLLVITTTISLIAWIIMICLTNKYTPYYAVLTMNVVGVAFDISWFFGAHERFRLIVIRNTIIKIVGIAILFIFVREKNDLLLYLGLTAASGLIGNISLWFSLPKFVCKVPIRGLKIKRHFKETLIYFIPTVATTIYTVLDKTMIGLITGLEVENGYYEQTNKITNMAITVVTSLNIVMAARMSYLYAEKKFEEIKDRLKRSMDFTMLLSIPAVVGIMCIAKNMVPWFFGSGYDKVVLLLYVYSPLIIIIAISNCLGGQYLTPCGMRARSSKGIIIGAVVNLACNAFLIPLFKSVGAAIASIIAESVITIIYMYMSKGFMSYKTLFKVSWKRIIACIPMAGMIIIAGRIPTKPLVITAIQVIIGGATYFATLWIMNDNAAKEFVDNYLKKIMKKVKRS